MIYIDKDISGNFIYYKSSQDKGVGVPDIDSSEVILTQSNDVKNLYKFNEVIDLSTYLGVAEDVGLYELFSFYFDGKVQNDFDMVEVLIKGLIEDSDWCFCLKIGVTFCWFSIGDRIKKLGTMQFSEVLTKYSVGKFIKRLRYNIVKSGISLKRVKYLVWDDSDIGNEFSSYITIYDCLETFFSRIDGLSHIKIEGVMHFLSRENKIKYIVNAENFVDCLNDSFNKLKLYQKDGVLYSRDVYYKDYSTCISSIVNKASCSYGLIIDCEGQNNANGSLDNGCRELGGIIYCRHNNILVNADTFSCDELMLEDTLLQVLKNYKEYAGSSSSISVLTFGTSDSRMLRSSIQHMCSKRNSNLLIGKFRFIDCISFILDHVPRSISGRNTLTNIAISYGVLPVTPKHKALNDARTLFNILACILKSTGDFIV